MERKEAGTGNKAAAGKSANTAARPSEPETEPFGSVLGVIDSDPDKKLPRAARNHGGNPRGIEVRRPATGTDELSQRSGFTSADMGGAGQGTTVPEDTETERPEQD